MFTKYFIVENWLIKIINRVIMLSVSLSKVRLVIKVRRHIKSVILTDVLHILQIKENLILVIKL